MATAETLPNPIVDPAVRRRRGPSPIVYLAAVVGLLAVSGAVRALQGRRFEAAARAAETAPVRLTDLPPRFGGWRALGPDIPLDSKTIEIAGCSDYVSRRYADEKTGAIVLALVAYGPAEKIIGHTPAICFPAVGYERQAGPIDRAVAADGRTARLRSYVFVKGDAAARERVHVYSAFRHAGAWTPDSAGSRKRFRHDPAMFKIQVQRLLGPNERLDAGNPIEQFSAALVVELERELAAQRPARKG